MFDIKTLFLIMIIIVAGRSIEGTRSRSGDTWRHDGIAWNQKVRFVCIRRKQLLTLLCFVRIIADIGQPRLALNSVGGVSATDLARNLVVTMATTCVCVRRC